MSRLPPPSASSQKKIGWLVEGKNQILTLYFCTNGVVRTPKKQNQRNLVLKNCHAFLVHTVTISYIYEGQLTYAKILRSLLYEWVGFLLGNRLMDIRSSCNLLRPFHALRLGRLQGEGMQGEQQLGSHNSHTTAHRKR